MLFGKKWGHLKMALRFVYAHAIECEDTLLRSETDTLEIVGVGLKGILAVAMPMQY